MHGLQIALSIVLGAWPQQPQDTSAADLARTTLEFDKIEANSKALHDSLTREKRPKSSNGFITTVPKFRRATEDFRRAISEEDDVKRAAQNVAKLIGPLKDYFDALKLKGKPVDSAEFKEFSQKELNWEALTTAERIDNDLQRAQILLLRTDRSGATSIKTMEFFMGIQSDFARLKWLSGKVRPVTFSETPVSPTRLR
jgi:hypothetical protein